MTQHDDPIGLPKQSRAPLVAGLLAVLVVGAGAAWLAWPEPEPEEPPVEDKDTGLSREQTEEMMREIGYVQ